MSTHALDFGAGNFKRVSATSVTVIPTQVATVTGLRMSRVAGMGSSKRPTLIEIDGHRYYVGAGAHAWGRPVENLDDSRFIVGSPELRALVYAALSDTAQTNDPLHVVIGLPQSALAADVASATVTGLRGWLRGVHHWTIDGVAREAFIAKVNISTQVAGAYFDYLLDDDGQYDPARRANYKREIGVVSVGMNNVELIAVKQGKPVPRFTASTTNGVRRLLERADPDHLYSRGELDAQLRAGTLDTSAVPAWASDIAGDIEETWGKYRQRFSAIYIIGGGAIVLGANLYTIFNGKTLIADDPILAVARGLMKLARRKGW